MPFLLTNAHASFQQFINEVLRRYLDDFCSEFIDDILIYSDTFEKHCRYVRLVLRSQEKAGHYIEMEKYKFHIQKTKYLALIILSEETLWTL